ncbi:MAG: DNA topoisomerase VI subunit B, partial [Planctomycetes bacterium]|nr:DNA topoisomerase VI subunit B [Planctomycetota bacterium]
YTSVTRPPAVYRGNPFLVEAGIAYGVKGHDADKQARLVRLANRVPLLHQQSSCAITKSVGSIGWRGYGLNQPNGSLPIGPMLIMVHVASVWVPFTSESKEAIAHYPEIVKQIRLALQECGRKLGMHVRRKKRVAEEGRKRAYIEKYIPHIGIALKDILSLNDGQEKKVVDTLTDVLERSRKG